MYAIIRDRGMQYRVQPGQVLDIARLPAEPGTQVDLGEVLLIGGAEQPVVGTPVVEGARVRATVLGDAKGKKIVVFKYRNKKRYRRRTGHRQMYTRVAISEIIGQGGETLAVASATPAPAAAGAPLTEASDDADEPEIDFDESSDAGEVSEPGTDASDTTVDPTTKQ